MYRQAGAVALTPVLAERVRSAVRGPKVPVPALLARLSAVGSVIVIMATIAYVLEDC